MKIISMPANKNYRENYEDVFKKDKAVTTGKQNKGNKLLREDLRQLPADLVTEEIGADGKVHEFDDPHVARTFIRDYKNAQKKTTSKSEQLVMLMDKWKAEAGQKGVNQASIDIVRFRVLRSMLDTAAKKVAKGREAEAKDIIDRHKYLWFPENDVENYELKYGNAPSDSDRPKHLKGLDLFLDPKNPPRRIVDVFKSLGLYDTYKESVTKYDTGEDYVKLNVT